MPTNGKSRRSFFIDSAAGLSAAWVAANSAGILAAQQHAQEATKFGFFSDAQAAAVEAITAQIIPTDETPGAREARCVYFIDKALTTFAKKNQAAYTNGLEELETKAGKFSALSSGQQIKALAGIEKTPFFTMIRNHTVIGFFSPPVHGGNAGKVGWKLINYDDSLNHKPPFGYYDAAAAGQEKRS